jgi:hypothetical protein
MSPISFGSDMYSPSIESKKLLISVGKFLNSCEISNEKFWCDYCCKLIVLWSILSVSTVFNCLIS